MARAWDAVAGMTAARTDLIHLGHPARQRLAVRRRNARARVCVCARVKERERDKERKREMQSSHACRSRHLGNGGKVMLGCTSYHSDSRAFWSTLDSRRSTVFRRPVSFFTVVRLRGCCLPVLQ